MQLPNLGALSLHHAVSAPADPSVVEIDESEEEEERRRETEEEEAALAALNASGFGAAERELIERKKQEEAPRWTVESKSSKRKPKSEAEKEAARLERNRKQRERNAAKSAAKSVESVVERLIKQVEEKNAAAKKPEVIDLTADDDDAPKEEKKNKQRTWWMIREEDSRTPKERHASNEGTYDRLELRKGSKGPRFKPPVPESDDELPSSPRSPPTMPAPELYS